ncbi:MAG: STAS domain-containing protein, partial [Candidatus Zixiibacteriota bacterium]
MDNISISLHESTSKEISEIRVDGVIDTLTASQLEDVIDSLVKREQYKLIVDLAGVEYISSAGWGIFISQIKDVRSMGGDIKLANMIPNVLEIYELLEFDNVLMAYTSLDDARKEFGSKNTVSEKKAQHITSLTVNDTSVKKTQETPTSDYKNSLTGNDDLETTALKLIKQDPFITISEIKTEFNKFSDTSRTSWWH